MADDLVLTAILKADASGMQSGFSQASSAMSGFKQAADSTGSSAGGFGSILGGLGSKLGGLGSVIGGLGSVIGGLIPSFGGLVGAGMEATKMAGDFQSGMTSLVTGAGEAESNIQQVSDGILSMATATGTTTKSLTDGMYMIESAGFRGADGLNVLKMAAEGAKVGNAQLKDVANGVVTALNDYSLSSDKSAMVTNTLIATVASGNTTMGALASSLKNVLPIASSAGISLNGVSAAMATMTGQSVPAGQAANYLKTMILALEAPSTKGAAVLQSIGLSAQDVASEMRDSLPDALQMITDHLKTKFPEGSAAYTAALKDITGGSSALSAMLDLTGDHMKTFKGNVDGIYSAVRQGGDAITGWSKVQGDFNFKMEQAKEVVETLGIKIGTVLLPVASAVVGGFADASQRIMSSVSYIASYVETALSKVDLTGLKDAWRAFSGEVSYLASLFGKFLNTLNPLGSALEQFGSDFDPIAGSIQNLAQGALNTLSNLLTNISIALTGLYSSFLQGQGPLATIKNAFDQVSAIIGGQLKADLAWLGTTFNQIGGWIKSSLMPALATLGPPIMSIADTVAKNILPAFAEFYATGHQLFESMLTPLIGVLENIIPPIISIAGWLAGALAEGFKFVAPLVKGLADAVSGLVNFFTKTEAGSAIVKAALIALSIPVGILALGFVALAIESIAAFLASIPAMVGGFLAGAAAAWSMAVAVIAATWPFLVVVGVIAAVILAIQHWGDIVNWLKGVWGAISSWFGGVLNGVKVWFVWLWTQIQVDAMKAWKAIQNFMRGALAVLIDIIMGPIYAIVAGFEWLYNHNYYFKALVDSIVNTVKAGVAWLQNTWQSIINWIVGSWQLLVAQATVMWDHVSMQIKIGWMKAVAYVEGVWNAISSFFVNAWNTYIAGPLAALWSTVSTFFSNVWTNYIVKPLTVMWTNVSNFFSNIWTNYIAGPIGDLWNQLTNTIGGWATKAVDWGKNLIKSFVNGIVSMANNVAGAIGGIAGKVLAFLGFHSPTKEGPGREADVWAPNFVKMYAEGLEAGLPEIQKAVNRLSTPLMLSLNPAASNYKAASAQPNFKYPAAGTGSGGAAPIVVNVHPVVNPPDVYMDHKKVTDIVATQLANKIRMKGGVRSH